MSIAALISLDAGRLQIELITVGDPTHSNQQVSTQVTSTQDPKRCNGCCSELSEIKIFKQKLVEKRTRAQDAARAEQGESQPAKEQREKFTAGL